MLTDKQIWNYLEHVYDPEIPVLSIIDLGIVRSVKVDSKRVLIVITPTYMGCPAMHTICEDIYQQLGLYGIEHIRITEQLSPAWTTDWLSDQGKKKLKEYGIAPPENEVDKGWLFTQNPKIPCPKCSSTKTRMISQFGSTACKALYQCQSCLEPFDYFKCLR